MEQQIQVLERQIRERRSVRSFDGQPISQADLDWLSFLIDSIETPYQIPVRFRLLDAKEHGLSSPVITGERTYIAAAVPKVPHGEEAFGFAFEKMVLSAQSMGLGTTWIGGTMDRKLFERAFELGPDERMPCVSPLGRPAEKMSLRESLMRKGVKADAREPFEKLFFRGSFETPLGAEQAGPLALPLELVRLAPSAVNRQPWRVVVCGELVHFYVKHAKGYVSEATGDLQKVDLGIALCHFHEAAEALGLDPKLELQDPGIPAPADTEYIASYRVRL